MGERVFVIAEAGVNHNGQLELAKQLVDVAVEAGADAVKFQTFVPEEVVSTRAPKAAYQLQTTDPEESQLEMIRRLTLPFEAFQALKEYCQQRGILFLSTPFDIPSARFLYRELQLPIIKIPSGEITNYPLLREIGSYKAKVILSTGMADLGEVEDALDVLVANGTKREDITVLHCNTEYPTPMEDVNLRAMVTIRNAFQVAVGYSDHTEGIEVPIAAVALGATVIEKHFTLDRTLPGPDHKASLEPTELRAMITAIRNIEKALGSGIKKPSASEQRNIPVVRKSIVARRSIRAGEILSEENLTTKRPGTGISPMRWQEIIGKPAPRDFAADELIEF